MSHALLLIATLGVAQADAFTDCEPPPGEPPALDVVTRCFYRAARATGDVERARAKVEQLAAENPESGWPLGTLASLQNMTDPTLAGAIYERAADLFEKEGEKRGLTLSLLNLNTWHGRRGELEEGRVALERAVAAAEASGERKLHASALSQQARWATYYEGDQFLAYELAQATLDVARELDDDSVYVPRLLALSAKQNALTQLGLHEASSEAQAELIALAHEHEDRRSEVNGLLDQALDGLEHWRETGRDPARRAALEEQLAGVVAMADEVSNEPIAALARCALGVVVEGPRGAQLVLDGLAATRGLDYPEDEAECLIRQATRLDAEEAGQIEALALEGAAAAARAEDPALVIRAQLLATQAAWMQDADRARQAGEATLALVEGLADRQQDTLTRARLFGSNANATYLHGSRLREHGEPAASFLTMERMRGRELVLQLERAAALAEAGRESEASAAYADALERLSAHQARLVGGEEEADWDGLVRLELEASRLRSEVLAALPTTGHLLAGPTLIADIQAALAPGEILVTTQLPQPAPDFLEPLAAWAFVVTTDAVHEVDLPDRAHLEDRVELYLGLVETRDSTADRAGARLYDELIAPVLETTSQDVERIVFVLDGPLQRLPLAALAPEGGAPLGTRVELGRAPSANLWLRWRQADRSVEDGALVLADPEHLAMAGPAEETRAGTWEELGTLGPLPGARDEGRALASLLGAEVWEGADASEGRLKQRPLAGTALLHFAAHAVVDARYPDRSAVLLSPGQGGDDGLLQAREIADLRLPGSLVVLSACQSATGALVEGEGVVGLARSFTVAGATGVIGSLWPVRDDEARAFFDAFYERLAVGATPGAALLAARKDRHEAGAPPHAWAGMVLVGDPARPVWTRPPGPSRLRWLLAGGGGVLLLAGLAVWRGRRG